MTMLPAVHAIGAPAARSLLVAGQKDPMATLPRDAPQPAEQGLSRVGIEIVMAQDDATAEAQRPDACEKRRAQSWIGHQPDSGTRTPPCFALRHVGGYTPGP